MSVMASPGVGGCRVCAVRFVCGVCYWVLDGIGDRTGGSTKKSYRGVILPDVGISSKVL